MHEGCFLVKTPDKDFSVSPQKVQSIVVCSSAALTTEALKLASENNVDVILLDDFGNPYGRVWHCRPGSTTAIRRRQLEIAEMEEGLAFVKQWVSEKMTNQIELLESLLRAREAKQADISPAIEEMRTLAKRLDSVTGAIADARNQIMSAEGVASRTYFGALSALLPERWQFEGRSRNPAKDPFNCLLNYAYGVLYGLVERACLLAGLDPYIGILHTDNYNKKSLVFDLIERYRMHADSTVFYLFSGRKVKDALFDSVPGGFSLSKEGKAALLESFNERLDKTVRHGGRNLKVRDTIQFDCHKFANALLGKTREDFMMEVEEI